jgi:type IV secretory pathway VirB10-like protein
MRARFRLVGVSSLGMLFALSASAQLRRPQKPAKPPVTETPAKPSEPPKPAADAAAAEPAPASAAPSGDDLGEPPPKATGDATAVRPSPLTPAPNEFPAGAPKPAPVAYERLMADIAALRSRVAAVTTTLFSSKLRVLVGVEGDDARVASFRVTLDDGVIYAAADRFGAEEAQVVYEHAVAPGHHMLGVEIERYDARNRSYRTFQSSKFAVVVPENQKLETSFRIQDDSDMADEFPDDQDGEYDLRVRLRAQVVE